MKKNGERGGRFSLRPARTTRRNEPVDISAKDPNAAPPSEEDRSGLVETLRLCGIPGMEEKIVEGVNTPIEDCVPEDKVRW